MASARITKQLLLRLSIYNYKAESKSEEETHNNVARIATKAAHLHAKYRMDS